MIPHCDAGQLYPLTLWIPTGPTVADPLSRNLGPKGMYAWLKQERARKKRAFDEVHFLLDSSKRGTP